MPETDRRPGVGTKPDDLNDWCDPGTTVSKVVTKRILESSGTDELECGKLKTIDGGSW